MLHEQRANILFLDRKGPSNTYNTMFAAHNVQDVLT